MKKALTHKMICILLVVITATVGIPLKGSAEKQTANEVVICHSEEDYYTAYSRFLSSGELSDRYEIDIADDVVCNESGETVEIYDDTIDEALEADNTKQAEKILEENSYDVIESTRNAVVVEDDFQTMRLIVKAPVLTDIMGAEKAIGYHGEYILSYASREDAISAYEVFSRQPDCTVSPDVVVSIDDDEGNVELSADSLKNGKKDHYSWGVEFLGLDKLEEKLENESYDLPEIKVAVLDSGIIRTNKYLEGRITVEGYNFISDMEDVTDDHGHGTHVSGIVADGTPDNVKILPVKVMNENGKGTLVTVRAGLAYSLNQGASVVNLSLSTADKDSVLNFLDTTLEELVSRKVIIINSAGNDQKDASYYYPPRLDTVIAIAALGNQNQIASYSNYGAVIDFAMPGSSVVSTYQEGLAYKSGTSMAAPHAAAAAALLKTWNPNLTQEEVKQIFIDNAVDMGDPGFDEIYGYGYFYLGDFDTTRPEGFHYHDYVITTTKEPECTTPGTKQHKCSICGDEYTTEIEPLGHTLIKTIHEASCTSEGYTEAKCTRCGEVFESAHTPKLSHDYQMIDSIPPTCEDSGKITYQCSMCGDEIYEYTASTGHNYKSEVTTPATHFKNGVMTYTCENCGDTYYEPIKKGKHTFVETVVAPKCEEGGYTIHTCSDPSCGYSYKDTPAPATGHSYERVAYTKPTADTPGTITYTCSVCQKTYTETIPPIQQPTEKPTGILYLLGDADGDGSITILDATAVQRWIADYPTNLDTLAADADQDTVISVLDVTAIQRYLVGMSSTGNIGRKIEK